MKITCLLALPGLSLPGLSLAGLSLAVAAVPPAGAQATIDRTATDQPAATATTAAGAPAQSGTGLEEAADAGRDVVVTANRAAQPVDRVGQSVTVIDTAAIERRQALTVSDLLLETPGVSVTRNGGLGAVTSVFIRGAESDQTVALIDGVKINDPSSPGGGFDFGNLLVGNVARIEVLRGAQSVLWGSQAIGGVVNVITRQPTDTLSINARAEGGWHDTAQGFANVSDKIGPVAASLGGGYLRTDGNSAFYGGRERDGYRNWGANGSVNVALARDLSVDLRGFYADGRTQIDGYAPPDYAFGDTDDYQRTRQGVAYGGVNLALFDGLLKNRLAYAYTDTRRRNLTPQAGAADLETFRSRGQNNRIEYQGVLDLGERVQATFGAEREVQRAATSSYGGPTEFGRARLWSGYGQVVVTPLAGLSVTGGVRHDDHDRFGGATTFSASGAWSPNGGGTVIRSSYSEGFKAPTLYQLGGDYGNALLRPERSHGWDAGVTQRAAGGALEASATWFHRTSTDLIAFVSCYPLTTGICTDRPFGTYDNVARAASEGLEAALTLKPVDGFVVGASYTYLDAQNRAAGADFGRRLARRPSQSVTVNADYRWSFGLTTGATLTSVGNSFDDAANARRLRGYVLAGLRASLPVTRSVEVYGHVENLFDQRYQVAYQYGQPGRAAFGGVRVRY